MAAAAAPDGHEADLLALVHQHLLQAGYARAAKELRRQSGQKTFPSPPASLQDIFAQWKKTCPQAEKRKADDTKKSIPAKIRVPDPKSSSESSDEEEAANAAKIKTNLSANNISVAKAETSSEDEDSSSEEEAVAGKVLKTPGTGNKTTDFLQLAAQKTNSFPGKGVAVAAVRAKEQQKKTTVSKALPPAVSKPGQKKAPSGKQGTPLQSPVVQGQIRAQAADEKKTTSSESSSSSSSESEKEKSLPAVKSPLPQPALKKAESSSKDSSDDSDSEEETKAAVIQVKPGVPRTQVSLTPVKSSPATIAPSKQSAVKVSLAKTKANQVSTPSGSAARSTSSETSDSSDSEEKKPSLAAQQTKPPGKTAQASTSLVKSAPSKGVSASAVLKQPPVPSITSSTKLSSPAKKGQSSESSGSSSENENEAVAVPVIQVKPGVPRVQVSLTPVKSSPTTVAPFEGSAVKVSLAKTKANQASTPAGSAARSSSSETSDSSDSEEEKPSSSAAQSKQPGKAAKASTPLVKNASSDQTGNKGVSASALLKQTPKPSITSLTKLSSPAKKVQSSESSESSSESENEALLVPVSQKRLQTPQPPTGTKQSQNNKPGSHVKAASSALKGKETVSESSSSSDSEDEVAPAASKLPPLSATKTNTAGQSKTVTKPQSVLASLQKAQQSEDSSQDSSDEPDSEEDSLFTQKAAQETQKSAPAKVQDAKGTGAPPANAQSTGKGMAKSAAASLQKTSESSETDSSDSSEKKAAGKPAKQPPIHPFFKQMLGKGAKGAQANSSSTSGKCQGPGRVDIGKVEQSHPQKTRPSQNHHLLAQPIVLLKRIDSLSSRSPSDSQKEEVEETAATTAKQIPQPVTPQKQGAIKEAKSSSEDSSDNDQEPSQSLLAGLSGPVKTPESTALKNASPALSKQSSGKNSIPGTSGLVKTHGKPAPANVSSIDSSDSDTDAEGTVGTKAETNMLSSSGKDPVVAKIAKGVKMAKKKEPGSSGPKASRAKKVSAKAQSNGKTSGTSVVPLPLTSLSKAQSAEVGAQEAIALMLGAAGQEGATATPGVAGKSLDGAKATKKGEKKKLSKKRKLAAGDAALGETVGKKLKVQDNPEALTKKKKKKKKAKSSDDTKTTKKKDGKEKKADKKKKKSKKLGSVSKDELQKKKKKKKKSGDLEGTTT